MDEVNDEVKEVMRLTSDIRESVKWLLDHDAEHIQGIADLIKEIRELNDMGHIRLTNLDIYNQFINALSGIEARLRVLQVDSKELSNIADSMEPKQSKIKENDMQKFDILNSLLLAIEAKEDFNEGNRKEREKTTRELKERVDQIAGNKTINEAVGIISQVSGALSALLGQEITKSEMNDEIVELMKRMAEAYNILVGEDGAQGVHGKEEKFIALPVSELTILQDGIQKLMNMNSSAYRCDDPALTNLRVVIQGIKSERKIA